MSSDRYGGGGNASVDKFRALLGNFLRILLATPEIYFKPDRLLLIQAVRTICARTRPTVYNLRFAKNMGE
jgi:hypothetical protein